MSATKPTVLERVSAAINARLGARRSLLLAMVGAVVAIVGTLMPWTYTSVYADDLTVYFYPAGPQLYVLVFALVALVLLLGEAVDPLGRVTRLVVPHGPAGTVRACGWGGLTIVGATIIAMAAELGGLVNVDPGGWITLVGALVIIVGGLGLGPDADRTTRKVLPAWVEIVVVAGVLAIVLYVIVVGLGIEAPESFSMFFIFVCFVAAVLARSGLFEWISQVAGRHGPVTIGAAFIVAFAFPLTQGDNNRFLNIAANVMIFACVAMGLNIVIGLAGLLDLGYIAFLGVGAYVGALLSGSQFSAISWTPPFPVVLLFGALAAGMAGVIIGVPSIRTRGDYLAIVTLGFGEIFRITVGNLNGANGPDLTNGSNGIPNIPHLEFFGWNLGEKTTLFGIQMGYFANYYFLELILLAFVIIVFSRANNSRVGRAWVAIREDETAAEAMGINTFRLKVTAFVLGASLAGLAGVLQSHLTTSVDPSQYQFLESAFLVAAIVLGGMGTVTGVLVGATILKLLPEKLRFFDNNRLLIFGIALIVMMRFRPEGIVPSERRAREFHQEEADEALALESIASADASEPGPRAGGLA